MENEAEIDEAEFVSKSQLKRESHALQDLGKRLAALAPDLLERIPLDTQLLEAIALARRIQNKRSALKRHYQYLGKLLRARDAEPIIAALAEIDRDSQQAIRLHHRAERWRDRIIDDGVDAIEALLAEAPGADRQKLRQLRRNLEHAKTDAKRVQHSRLVYQEVKRSLEG